MIANIDTVSTLASRRGETCRRRCLSACRAGDNRKGNRRASGYDQTGIFGPAGGSLGPILGGLAVQGRP
jgi:hypothetical protein